MEEILSGTFDKNQIQIHKIPFYNELCRTHAPLDKIGTPISPANVDNYWINMNESTALSPSGRHVVMYKATVTKSRKPRCYQIQERLGSMILSINNCATQTGIMPEQREGDTNIMIQTQFNIGKLLSDWAAATQWPSPYLPSMYCIWPPIHQFATNHTPCPQCLWGIAPPKFVQSEGCKRRG